MEKVRLWSTKSTRGILKILFTTGLLLLAAISNAQENRYIKTTTYEVVIFAKHITPSVAIAKHPYFPTDMEIATMEKKNSDSIGNLFSAYLKTSFYKVDCDFAKDLQIYKRQYYGYRKDGDKVILVYFYRQVPKNWKEMMYPIEQECLVINSG